jgi:bacillithiol system protein YtxJ
VGALDSLVERSHAQPVIVFQHDPFCPISRRAQRELAGLPIEAALVDVARDGAVSRMLEQRTGVPHESPQVLVFRAGRVAWTASHFGITRGALARALQLGSTPPS